MESGNFTPLAITIRGEEMERQVEYGSPDPPTPAQKQVDHGDSSYDSGETDSEDRPKKIWARKRPHKESDRKYYFGAPPAKKRSSKVKDSIPTGSKMWNVNVAGGSKWRQVLEIPPTYTDKEFEKLNQVYLNELAGKKWDVVLPLLTQDDLQAVGIGDQGGHSDSGNEGGDEMSQEVTGNSTQYFDAMDKSVVLPDDVRLIGLTGRKNPGLLGEVGIYEESFYAEMDKLEEKLATPPDHIQPTITSDVSVGLLAVDSSFSTVSLGSSSSGGSGSSRLRMGGQPIVDSPLPAPLLKMKAMGNSWELRSEMTKTVAGLLNTTPDSIPEMTEEESVEKKKKIKIEAPDTVDGSSQMDGAQKSKKVTYPNHEWKTMPGTGKTLLVPKTEPKDEMEEKQPPVVSEFDRPREEEEETYGTARPGTVQHRPRKRKAPAPPGPARYPPIFTNRMSTGGPPRYHLRPRKDSD